MHLLRFLESLSAWTLRMFESVKISRDSITPRPIAGRRGGAPSYLDMVDGRAWRLSTEDQCGTVKTHCSCFDDLSIRLVRSFYPPLLRSATVRKFLVGRIRAAG